MPGGGKPVAVLPRLLDVCEGAFGAESVGSSHLQEASRLWPDSQLVGKQLTAKVDSVNHHVSTDAEVISELDIFQPDFAGIFKTRSDIIHARFSGNSRCERQQI